MIHRQWSLRASECDFRRILLHFSASVHLDVEAHGKPSMAKVLVVEGSGVAGTPGGFLPP